MLNGLSTKWKIAIVGALIGGVGGYLYYYFIGCTSGSCSITSSPVNSTIYGMLLGGLASDMLPTASKNSSESDSKEE